MKTTVLFLSCEHAVNTIPIEYASLFEKHDGVLNTHRAIDFGALYIATHLSHTFHCDMTTASVSRLIIDCNRSISNASCFSEFTTNLPQTERQRLIDKYYLPYRKQTESLIQKNIDVGYQVLHISCHTFTPIFEGTTRNAGIGILYDPIRHGEKEVSREWSRLLNQYNQPYRVRMNYPYKGKSDGFTSALRKKYPENEYLGLELEVNQTLTMDEQTLQSVAVILSTSLQELLELL